MQFNLGPTKNALHWEAILCIQYLWILNRFSEVIDQMFEGSEASISLQGYLYGGVFKVDGFHNVDTGREAGSKKLHYKSSEKYFQPNCGVK